jgi:hypothetical protein
MSFSSALDGVTVSNSGFVDVSMIEEVYAVEKRKANRSGPNSDASDTRTSKNVTQNVQPDQPAEVPVAGPSAPTTLEYPRAVAYSRSQPVTGSSGHTKLVRKEPAPAGVIRMMVGKPETRSTRSHSSLKTWAFLLCQGIPVA